jgi:hypothetical protein
MDYFSRKSLSKYLMNTIEFHKYDVDIFIKAQATNTTETEIKTIELRKSRNPSHS